MKEGTRKLICVITTILFIIASLLILAVLILRTIDSKAFQIIYYIVGILFIAVVAALLQAKFFVNNKFIIFKIVVINLFTFMIFIFLYFQIPTPKLREHFGNNINVYSYQNAIGGKAYKDFDDAVSGIKTEKGMTELYCFDAEKYAVIFYKNDEQIISYEFLKQDGSYYTYGSRKLIYDDDNWNSALADKEYTEEETMLADIEVSVLSSHDELLNQSGQYPAFGVLSTSRIQNVDISGQPVDTVIEIKNEQGKAWFFWFIENLNIQEIDEVEINGL